MEGVIESVLEKAGKQGIDEPGCVTEVVLRLGALEAHSEVACQQAYDLLTTGTILEGSHLRIVNLPVVDGGGAESIELVLEDGCNPS